MIRSVAVCTFTVLLVAQHAAAGDWPSFRGPAGDGAVADRLVASGEPTSLEIAWKTAIGPGYSSLAVADGRVVTMFTSGADDVIGAFSVDTGAELWRYRIAAAYPGHDGSHDGPISTPCIADGKVFALAPRGELAAVDAATGAELWTTHLADDHGAKKPHYGFTTAPVVAAGVVVLELGAGEGKAIAGFDATSGELRWTTGSDEIAFHSPVLATIGGERQVVAAGQKNLYGLDPRSGDIQWSYEHDGDGRAMGGHTIVPLVLADGRIFLMNNTEASVMLEVVGEGGEYEVSELWTTKGIKRSYVSPVHHDGLVYGMSNRIFAAVDAATGELVWRSRNPGDGFPTVIGDHLAIMTKPGSLHVARSSRKGYEEVAAIELFDQHSWSEVAYADGHLFARSMGQLARIDASADTALAHAGGAGAATGFAAAVSAVGAADDKEAAVDRLLAAYPDRPIVEETGAVHFLYRGDATDIGLVSDVIGYRREDPMTRVEGTDLFYYTAQLEPDAAVSYGFIVDYTEEAIADPANPRAASGLFGDVSLLTMPAWREPDHLGEAEAARRGRLEPFELAARSAEAEPKETAEAAAETADESEEKPPAWTYQVYLPAGYGADSDERYPVAYFHGGDALTDGAMKNALDNLIGRSVAPLIAVFISHVEDSGPMRGDDAATLYDTTVASELVPQIDAAYRTIATPLGRASIGAGRASRLAFALALDHPELFARVGSLGASILDSNDVIAELGAAAEQPLVVYLGWGTYHLRSPHEAWDMARSNREIWAALRERGYRPAGGERPEGYGWSFWQASSDEMLTALLPLPRQRPVVRSDAAATSATGSD